MDLDLCTGTAQVLYSHTLRDIENSILIMKITTNRHTHTIFLCSLSLNELVERDNSNKLQQQQQFQPVTITIELEHFLALEITWFRVIITNINKWIV